MEDKAIEAMEEALSMLVSKYPSLGYLSFKLRWFPDSTCRTAWTDGVSVGYNPEYVMSLSRKKRMFLAAHEIGHPMFGHHLRREGRDNTEWNVSCDHVINLMLSDAGLQRIEGALCNPEFRNMSAEEIHKVLFGNKKQEEDKGGDSENGKTGSDEDGNSDSQPGGGDQQDEGSGSEENDEPGAGGSGEQDDQGESSEGSGSSGDEDGSEQDPGHGDGNEGSGEPGESEASQAGNEPGSGDSAPEEPGDQARGHGQPHDQYPGEVGEVRDFPGDDGEATQDEQDIEAEKWEIAIQQAAQIARKQQGDLPGFIETVLTDIGEPKLPWREIIARWMDQKAKTDYNMAKPNPRYSHTGFFMPSLHSEELGKVAMFWDTSCSVTDDQVADIASETCGLLTHYPGVEVELFHIDTEVRHIETIDQATDWDSISAKGRGGTDFRPGFDFLEDDDEEDPVGVIYMTDGECDKFPEAPHYPVLWVIIGMGEYERFEPPFGEVAYYVDY